MNYKNYIAEFIGTFFLVLFGTGAVTLGNGSPIVIAFAFGLAITLMVYAIGPVSGAHINPAVSLAMYINKRMSLTDMVAYWVSQILGAIVASSVVKMIISSMTDTSKVADGFGSNSYATIPGGMAFFVEALFAFLFIFIILMVTSEKFGNSNIAGFVIGLTLTVLIFVGLPLTGVSVNPARSIGPALYAGGDALSQLWVFILAPLVGGALAAFVAKYIFNSEEA